MVRTAEYSGTEHRTKMRWVPQEEGREQEEDMCANLGITFHCILAHVFMFPIKWMDKLIEV